MASETSTTTTAATDRFTATGIGVADLERSATFYEEAFGLVRDRAITLPYMDEIIMTFPGGKGAAVVLMHWTDGSERDYGNNAIKLVFQLDDPTATARKIEAAGGTIVMEPTVYENFGGATIGFGADPDGYQLELLRYA